MTTADESRLFRFTIKHSVFLMLIMGIVSLLYAYVFLVWGLLIALMALVLEKPND